MQSQVLHISKTGKQYEEKASFKKLKRNTFVEPGNWDNCDDLCIYHAEQRVFTFCNIDVSSNYRHRLVCS